MIDSQRYRSYAGECLQAAKEAGDPYYRRLALCTAAIWLKLEFQDEAVNRPIASWRAVDGKQAADGD
jgi:hypothetical protein